MHARFILVTRPDMEKIGDFLRYHEGEEYEDLKEELERAQVIGPEQAPQDLVTMNATVTYYNEDDDKKSTITLVYPSDANWAQGKISILAPLGSALIGLRVGQSIRWPFPGGKKKKLTILEVHPHTEAVSKALTA